MQVLTAKFTGLGFQGLGFGFQGVGSTAGGNQRWGSRRSAWQGPRLGAPEHETRVTHIRTSNTNLNTIDTCRHTSKHEQFPYETRA